MALYAFDGTWSEDREGTQGDTNVFKFYQAYQEDPRNLYIAGIGTRFGWLGRAVGGAFGIGGRWRVGQAMDRLKQNIAARDTTVDVVGFSRGAATAIDFVNRASRDHGEKVTIRFVGLWDCVASFGVPGNSVNVGWDLDIPAAVEKCYHALALDEGRVNFPVERLETPAPNNNAEAPGRLFELWFRGVHSDVGGGNGNVGLSSITLSWMLRAAERHGVPVSAGAIGQHAAAMQPEAPIKRSSLDKGVRVRAVRWSDAVHQSVSWRANHNNPPTNLSVRDDALAEIGKFGAVPV